jgi:hypothetical protein
MSHVDNEPRELILIYQMGKVASQTIEKTLRKARPNAKIVRTHCLSLERYDHSLRTYAVSEAARASLLAQRAEAEATLELLERGACDVPVKVITGSREPIGQRVAGAFQGIESNVPDYQQLSPGECASRVREKVAASLLRRGSMSSCSRFWASTCLRYRGR